MLQQTRTEAVKPYFTSWMERFPTIEAWQRRTRQMYFTSGRASLLQSRQKSAQSGSAHERKLRKRHAARKGRDQSLPGIGDYTAGAILSMAFGKKEAAIDGNVLRVYARLYGIEDDILKTAGRKKITQLVCETLPDRAGDFNEALMDLGANVCIPKHPRCDTCPLSAFCEAFHQGRVEELPHRTKKKPQQELCAACAICVRDGKVLLHKRPRTGMLAPCGNFP